MSENNCAVYVHVNLINGKKYFGITIQEPEKRWKNGHGYYDNAHFKNAILKYGWENFAHFVLYKNIPIKIAKNIEEMLIREHFSYDPRFGYNKTMGGELEIPSEEVREAISEAMKEYYENNPEARKPVEAIDRKNGKRVCWFSSTMEADRAGFNSGHVCDCCNGKRKTHKGYIWRYVQEVSESDGDN